MSEAEILEKSKKELVDSIPKIILYGGTLIIIWLFSKLVFIPLGDGTLWGDIKTSYVIVLITVVFALLLILKVLKEIKDISDALAGFIALAINKKSTPTELMEYQKAVRGVLYVFVVVLLYMYFGSMLSVLHPALSGVVLIAVFMWAVWTLYSAAMSVSGNIERVTKSLSAKLLERGGSERKPGE